jgi:hypothetical protein
VNPERTSTNTIVKQNTIKRDIQIKDDSTKYKRGFEQRYEKPQKKRKKPRNSGNKKSV